MIKKICILFAGAATLLAMAGCDGTSLNSPESGGGTDTIGGGATNGASRDVKTYRIGFIGPLTGDAGALAAAVEAAGNILYLGDNTGEIVLDRLPVEELPRERVTFAVRGGPIINDATREDALSTGMTDLVPVIDNGSDVPGTDLEQCSREFQEAFEAADLVIAKGQGNYETLSDNRQSIFFLLKAKCAVIAENIGCRVGDAVITRSQSFA